MIIKMTELLTILLIILIFLSACSTKIRIAKVELVNKVVYQEEIEQYPIKVISSRKNFEKVLGNKNKSISKLYPKLDTMFFDFENYDYVFSFGKALDRLEYGKSLSKKHDFCDYLGKTPVFPVYSKTNDRVVYVYKLEEKNQYRQQCP